MAVNLVTEFIPYVDEVFTKESKKQLLTNQDFTWTGAHTIKVHKINSVPMTDYDRDGSNVGQVPEEGEPVIWSRFGALSTVENSIEEFTLTKDRSFTFVIDKLDNDETGGVLAGASALARQQREVIIPEIDTYTYGKMVAGAGTTVTADPPISAENIYDAIIEGNSVLDDALVPETGRVLVVTPDTYRIMKRSSDITLNTDIGENMRLNGVIANLDGLSVIKVPKSRLPEDFIFMIAHPVACVAPTKLAEYRVHSDPPGISGELVEGRICYDAFVLDNKKKAIYVLKNSPDTE